MVRLLRLVALIALLALPATAQDRKEVDLTLAMGIDISGSIDPDEAKLQREGYVQAFRDPVIIKAILAGANGRIAVAYFEWSDAWVQRYEGKSASTDDYIALATEVSRVDVTAFLRDWLYGTKTPAMPGHPDWTLNPIKQTNDSTSPTATSTAPALRSR